MCIRDRVKTAPVFAFESGSRRPFRYRDELSARIEFQNGCDRPRHRHTSLIEFREVMRYARVGICHLFIFKHSNFRDLISSALLISRDRRFDLQAFLLIDPIGIKPVSYTHLDVYKRQGISFLLMLFGYGVMFLPHYSVDSYSVFQNLWEIKVSGIKAGRAAYVLWHRIFQLLDLNPVQKQWFGTLLLILACALAHVMIFRAVLKVAPAEMCIRDRDCTGLCGIDKRAALLLQPLAQGKIIGFVCRRRNQVKRCLTGQKLLRSSCVKQRGEPGKTGGVKRTVFRQQKHRCAERKAGQCTVQTGRDDEFGVLVRREEVFHCADALIPLLNPADASVHVPDLPNFDMAAVPADPFRDGGIRIRDAGVGLSLIHI